MFSLLWLPDVLKAAGLTVQAVDGWQTRGHGDFGKPQGILCFVADTLVLAKRGLTPIQEIVIGDEVWTHQARWKRVSAIGSRPAQLHLLKGNGHPGLLTTSEHPFLSYSRWRKRVKGQKVRGTSFEGWTEAKDLKGMLWCSPADFEGAGDVPDIENVGRERPISLSKELMWLLGYWLGDGSSQIGGQITLYSNLRDVVAVEQRVRDAGFSCSVHGGASESVKAIVLHSSALAKWFEQHFGKLAHGKTVPAWMLSASKDWKELFLDGYLTADGGKIKQQDDRANRVDAVSVSKKIAIGIKLLAQSLGISTSLHLRMPEPTKLIGNRTVNQRPWWVIRLTKDRTEQSHGHFVDGRYASPCRHSYAIDVAATVYNISVEEDESYVADGFIVHNCHHTCGPKDGDIRDLHVLVDGRPDLGGPLCNLGLARSGVFWVVAAGKAWHAGRGLWQGVSDGNSHLIGIEAENIGTSDKTGNPLEPWSAPQIDAYKRGCAAILKHIGAAPIMCAGHKEFALPHGRKDDPNFDMDKFRADVATLMTSASSAPSVPKAG